MADVREGVRMIVIAPGARVSTLADIEDSVRGSTITIEDGAVIDSFVKIKFAGGDGNITICRNAVVNAGCVIYSGHGVVIGPGSRIAANSTLVGAEHEYRERSKTIWEQRFAPSRGGILIEEDVWVGTNCVLLDGSILRKGCVVGAHSLVRAELDPYSVNVGIPTKIVGYRE